MDLEHAQIGRRVRELREWRDMDQAVVAGLAGLSPSYLSMIERGKRPVSKRSVLESLARALRVAPTELTGTPYSRADDGNATTEQSAMAALADLLGAWWLGEIPDAPARPIGDVLADLEAFHSARNSSGPQAAGDYTTQVATLAPLIRDLLAAAGDPQDGRRALAPLLTAYHVAGSMAVRLGIPGMPSLAADRMRQVAEQLDDPVWTAVADWGRAHFLSGTNRQRQYDLAVAAADAAPAERPETRGMAHLTAALAAAAQDQPDVAEMHLDEADVHASLVNADVSPWPSGVMQFGRTNVGIFRVTIGVELGHGARVAEYAANVHPETISRGRQASFWLEYGRGMLAERRTRQKGLAALIRAEHLAPQQVRHNPFARDAVTHLLALVKRGASGRELRGLAWRMGIAPTG